MTSNILITGANGQLGKEMQNLIGMVPDCNFMFTDREQLDLTNLTQMKQLFEKYHFAYCINAAAYTGVDKAENDAEKAALVNITGVKNLAEICTQYDATLLHISTDFVFDGTKSFWYNEQDTTNPLSVYGKTKLAGEEVIRVTCPKHIIIRTAWLYSSYGNNFVKTMLRLAAEKPAISVVADQTGTPTYARDLAKLLMTITNFLYQQKLQNLDLSQYFGLYHYSNEGTASWYDFAKATLDLSGLQTPIKPLQTADYPTAAVRPKFSVLDKSKVKQVFGIEVPHWQESLKKCIAQLQLQESLKL
jgi:dTDP-4-dehydrorhamnose reductase